MRESEDRGMGILHAPNRTWRGDQCTFGWPMLISEVVDLRALIYFSCVKDQQNKFHSSKGSKSMTWPLIC